MSIYRKAVLIKDAFAENISCQYVWGARSGHRDELILRDSASPDSESSGEFLVERLWCLMDYYDPTSVVDNSGAVVERYRFSAFGLRSVMDLDFNPRMTSDYAWDFAFKGQFLDLDTGYYNYGYRYYSPELGRWLSRDPIGEKGGNNLYVIVGNNLTNHHDSKGLRTISENDYWDVTYGGDACGEIDIEKYQVNPGATTNAAKSLGAQIFTTAHFYPTALKETANGPEFWCCKCGDFRWISTVTQDTAPDAPDTPYLDLLPGHKGPYYDTKGGNGKQLGGVYEFVDKPFVPGWQLATKFLAGQTPTVTVKFTTKLVCATENDKVLTSFDWGFTYSAGGNGGFINRSGTTYLDTNWVFSINLL